MSKLRLRYGGLYSQVSHTVNELCLRSHVLALRRELAIDDSDMNKMLKACVAVLTGKAADGSDSPAAWANVLTGFKPCMRCLP